MDAIDRSFQILMVDDDAEDCLLAKDALAEAGLGHRIHFVGHGEELFDYLHRRGAYENGKRPPRSDLILLDLNMPRMDGREVLRQRAADNRLRRIPIVVLTTSTSEEDVHLSYEMGANSFIAKPTTFRQWVDLIRQLSRYWFELVELPEAER
jgi:CheY-like chemotaxis protein